MEIYVENTSKKQCKNTENVAVAFAAPHVCTLSLSVCLPLCCTTCVLYFVGHMLPGPLHLLLLAVARMRVVPQTGLILHQLHEFHIENGIILACHARTFSNTAQCRQTVRTMAGNNKHITHTHTVTYTHTHCEFARAQSVEQQQQGAF